MSLGLDRLYFRFDRNIPLKMDTEEPMVDAIEEAQFEAWCEGKFLDQEQPKSDETPNDQ